MSANKVSEKVFRDTDLTDGPSRMSVDIAKPVGAATVVSWLLESSKPQPPAVTESSHLEYNRERDQRERVIELDRRRKVEPRDYALGGKYRSVVKLFCQYASQEQGPGSTWSLANGWLIQDNVLVAAGHCAYDWNYSLGALKRVKVYVGYCGKDNVGDPIVEFRNGAEVATTIGWLKNQDSGRASDVSFIRLEKGFTGIKPLKYRDTPEKDTLILGVVGYLGDKIDATTGERGAFIYEDFARTSFNLDTSEYNMLHYVISTYGGNSGSPVLQSEASNLTSIGTHVYCGATSSCSVISDKLRNFGNPYKPYIAALKGKYPAIDPPANVEYSSDMRVVEIANSTLPGSSIGDPTTEGFVDILGSRP